MTPLTDALRAAAEAMANKLDLLAQDASDASGDATDGTYLRDLAAYIRAVLLAHRSGAVKPTAGQGA